jgi:hypothetical protein
MVKQAVAKKPVKEHKNVLLHVIQGADVQEDDHIQALLQVAHELELLDQARPEPLLSRRLLRGWPQRCFFTVPRALAMPSILLVRLLALPGRGARGGIIVHRSPQLGDWRRIKWWNTRPSLT